MSILLSTYENSLIGRSAEISTTFFCGTEAGGENQKTTLTLLHFAFEYVLGWEPKEVIQRMDMYYIKKMKLFKALSFIDFPMDVRKTNVRYILSLMYPDLVHLNPNERTEIVFRRVIDTGCQFPREYFIGMEGYYRFCACFRYFVENCYPLDNISDIYHFCFSAKGKKVLNDLRLLVPAKQFEINFMDVIHDCTEHLPYADFYYVYYQFLQQLSTVTQVAGFVDIDHISDSSSSEI